MPDRLPTRPSQLEDRTFLLLIVVVTLAFGWIVQPMFGAILWALIAAVVFAPLHRAIRARMPGRSNLAAALALLTLVGTVIVPALILGALVVDQLGEVYARLQPDQIDAAAVFGRVQAALPDFLREMLARVGLDDLGAVRDRLTSGLMNSIQGIAKQMLSVGQGAFSFVVALGVMLYLSFFMLRDAEPLAARVRGAVPLSPELWDALVDKFLAVVRATVKGSLVVAVVQGAIGGTVFALLGIQAALLWGVLMAAFSLLPAIGTGIVWVPVAIWLLANGAIVKGLILAFCGLFVIGMVDNVLRPILVGRDTRMPDYVVLVTTLGGLEIMGFNGIVIGPVIAAMFIAAWDIFARTRRRAAELAQAE